MGTVYQISRSCLIAKDMIFGWVINGLMLTSVPVDLLEVILQEKPGILPEEFFGELRKVVAERKAILNYQAKPSIKPPQPEPTVWPVVEHPNLRELDKIIEESMKVTETLTTVDLGYCLLVSRKDDSDGKWSLIYGRMGKLSEDFPNLESARDAVLRKFW